MLADDVFQRVFSSERGTLFCVNFIRISLQLLYGFRTHFGSTLRRFVPKSNRMQTELECNLIGYANFLAKIRKNAVFGENSVENIDFEEFCVWKIRGNLVESRARDTMKTYAYLMWKTGMKTEITHINDHLSLKSKCAYPKNLKCPLKIRDGCGILIHNLIKRK